MVQILGHLGSRRHPRQVVHCRQGEQKPSRGSGTGETRAGETGSPQQPRLLKWCVGADLDERPCAGRFECTANEKTVLTAEEVVVDADVSKIPVGIDGETVTMPTAVCCTIQPRAPRVRVPRNRPGVRPAKPRLDWSTLRRLASFSPASAGTR